MDNIQALNTSDDLIKSAEAYLERLPTPPEEVIEQWARIGKVVAEKLTEIEVMNLLLGNCDVTVEPKSGR
ncbi:hypothetical protein [Paraglaciecola chathamensis]|uniref:hypothetical protein n=1 Tax=Paraglaciecola chathamensis TaxID=368405 RepID=UPI0026FFF262|nr:hypothetical protein [Paraglaciecola chathamensis]MDO6560268.1 hypothetical protein [Paraglaciecola chathamensis]